MGRWFWGTGYAAVIGILFVVSLAGSDLAAQQMHRWVDEDGQVHFSQTPPPDQSAQETERVTYDEPARRHDVDHECCASVRSFSAVVASYLGRGMSVLQVHELFPVSEYPHITEIVNFIGPVTPGGASPAEIGNRAFSVCMNRRFQACRIDAGSAGSGSRAASSTGSGVIIGPNRVLTNEHVVRGCGRILVSDAQVSGSVMARDEDNDLALIESELTRAHSISLAPQSEVRLGQDVVVAGFPLSNVLETLNVTTGSVSSVTGWRGSQSLFQITAPVQPGSSGGPVLDSNGALIGLVVSRLADAPAISQYGAVPQNINFAINPAVIKGFLNARGFSFQESTASGALSTEDIATQAQQHTVRVFCAQ